LTKFKKNDLGCHYEKKLSHNEFSFIEHDFINVMSICENFISFCYQKL